MPLKFTHTLLTVVFTCAALTTLAADAAIDLAQSSVVATFKQENVPVEAPFRRFSGTINYDAEDVGAARAALEVETGSLDMGDDAYNAELRRKSWFDSVAYPRASFRSSVIKAGTAGQFTATGLLTIKGKTATLTIPVKVSNTGTSDVFDGTLIISRKAFGIGEPVWDEVLDDKVSVRFHLVVPR